MHRRDGFTGYAGRGGANRTIKGAGMVLVSSLMKLCYNVLGGLFEPPNPGLHLVIIKGS
jgi:hypothetical protein